MNGLDPWQAFLIVFFAVLTLAGLLFWLKKMKEDAEDLCIAQPYGFDDGGVRYIGRIPEDVRYRSLFVDAGIRHLAHLGDLDALTDVKGIGPERANQFAVDLKNRLSDKNLSAVFEKNTLVLPGGHTVRVTEKDPEEAASA